MLFEDLKAKSPKRKADRSSTVKAKMGRSTWKDGIYRIAPRAEESPTLMTKRASFPREGQGIWGKDEVCRNKNQSSQKDTTDMTAYEESHTYLSTFAAEPTDASMGECVFIAMVDKYRNRHICCVVRLDHVKSTRFHCTTSNEIQCMGIGREVESSL